MELKRLILALLLSCLPVAAQTNHAVVNLTAPTLANICQLTGNLGGGTTWTVMHLSPNQPVAGQASVQTNQTVTSQVGSTVTLSCTPPSSEVPNNGSYTVLAFNNYQVPGNTTPPCINCEVVISCPSCTQWNDESPDSISSDTGPILLAASGMLHVIYSEGNQHDSGCCTNILWKFSTNGGNTWSNPLVVATDAIGACSADPLTGSHQCAMANEAAGVAPNGKIVVNYTKFDAVTGYFHTYYSKTCDPVTLVCSAEHTILTSPDPVGSNITASYGNLQPCGGRMAMFMWDEITGSVGNSFLYFSNDNGQSWGTPVQVTAPGAGFTTLATNEAAFWCNDANNIILFVRSHRYLQAGCVPLTSNPPPCGTLVLYATSNGGSAWTAAQVNFQFSLVTGNAENIAPSLLCNVPLAGYCTLIYMERNWDINKGELWALVFLFSDAQSSAENLLEAQPLWSTGQVSSGYPSFLQLSTTGGILVWHSYPFSAASPKLYTAFFSFIPSYGAVGNRVVPVQGLLR